MKKLKVSISCVLVAGLVACGGGSTGSPTQPFAVTGMAATGAPMANATLQIYGKDGLAVLASPVAIASDGSYSATIPAAAVGPFVFEVDNGTDKVYSVMPDKTSSVVNVTPLSHLIAARLSPTGNPFSLASELAASTATISATATAAASTTVMAAIQPVITALGLGTTVNPLNTAFVANGAGFDRLLDSLDIKIEPKTGGSNIDITLKQTVNENEDLPKISFSNLATPTALPAVDPSKLVATGLTPKIQALLDKLTACFAVPLSTRITANGSAAADIQSQVCKDAFLGGSPVAYKSGGLVVSKTQHFGGIFTAESTAGVAFADPKFFYQVGTTVPNGPMQGDIVFGYRWKDEYGNFQIEKNVGRIDTDGKLKLIGNQYLYDGGVGPYSQRRNFLNQPASTYSSVGYTFNLSCFQLSQSKAVGSKIVKVNVTAPNNRVITLIPNVNGSGTCNYSYFVIASSKDASGNTTLDGMGDPSTPTGTGFIRLRSQYEAGPTTVSNHPRKLEKTNAFLGGYDGTDLTDTEIESIPQYATWKYEYYKATATGSVPVATQYFKTTARALTIDGFKKVVKLPELTAVLKTSLTADSVCSGMYCYVTQAQGPFTASWTKSTDPGLAPATYLARIYGRKDKAVSTSGYEDSLKFGSSRTSASIRCGQGEATLQDYCTGTAANASFGANASIDSIDLVSRAPDGTDVSHFHALRKLTSP